jgi:hypothetical protein
MPAADFVSEWFESEPLRATVAAAGLLGGFAGPRSAGTTAALLWLGAGADQPIAPGGTAVGGIGAVTTALAAAARAAGVEIRTNARVLRILVKDETAAGVALDNGDEIRAAHVVHGRSGEPCSRSSIRCICRQSPRGGSGTSACRHDDQNQLRLSLPAFRVWTPATRRRAKPALAG